MRGIREAFTTVDYVGISAYVPQVRCCWQSSSCSVLLKRMLDGVQHAMPAEQHMICAHGSTWLTTGLVVHVALQARVDFQPCDMENLMKMVGWCGRVTLQHERRSGFNAER